MPVGQTKRDQRVDQRSVGVAVAVLDDVVERVGWGNPQPMRMGADGVDDRAHDLDGDRILPSIDPPQRSLRWLALVERNCCSR